MELEDIPIVLILDYETVQDLNCSHDLISFSAPLPSCLSVSLYLSVSPCLSLTVCLHWAFWNEKSLLLNVELSEVQ